MAKTLRSYTFDLTRFGKVDVESVCIREIRFVEQQQARDIAAKSKKDWTFELLRMAIVEVDGIPVDYPWGGLDDLNAKTVGFLFMAFNEVNTIGTDEEGALKDFLAQAVARPR